MRSWQDRVDQARRHVADGRRVIERQQEIIDRKKALGFSTQVAEELLARFESSQAIFEADLDRIAKEHH